MTRYKLIIAYNGTDYFGWQKQDNQRTIAGTLEQTFKDVFKSEIKILGASRTDAGVHAQGQVAIFDTSLNIPDEKLLYAWNAHLPLSIQIKELFKSDADFNPLANVYSKTYQYKIFTKRPEPQHAAFGYFYPKKIDHQKLHGALTIFIGTHDFRSFCTGNDRENTIRTILSIHIEDLDHQKAEIIITIKGPGFLRYMIRRIIGACLHVASHDKLTIETLKEALQAKNPEQTLPNAPACGLHLMNIEYAAERK